MTEDEKTKKWKALRIRGLRQRWIVNTIMPVLVPVSYTHLRAHET